MATYSGISAEAFRHPLDKQAEQALRSVPGFDLIARKFVEFIYERPQLVYLMGNSIQVGPRQYSTLYRILRECVRDLDVYPEPKVFVSQDPHVNSYSLGNEQPYIVVNTALLDLLNEDEIRCVIAHELGHIKCGHTLLIQMAIWTMNAASAIGELTFGLGNIITSGLMLGFYEWRRKAELSSDRAALLVMDNVDLVIQTMMKLSGGSTKYLHECNLAEFKQQGVDYQNLDEDGLNQIYKLLVYNGFQGMMLSHPFPVDRCQYLQQWARSEEYQQIRQGNYQREQKEVSVDRTSSTSDRTQEVDTLKQEIEDLQREIDRLKRGY
jgi:Zn-dependent protease with chaperone function